MRGANQPSTVKSPPRFSIAPSIWMFALVAAPCSDPALPSGSVTVGFGGLPANAQASDAPARQAWKLDMPRKPVSPVSGDSPTASRPSTPPFGVTSSGQ